MAGPTTLVGNYDFTNNGVRFTGLKATAAAIPITSTTAPVVGLWNPYGTSVKLVVERISFGWVATTEAPGNLILNQLQATGASAATGAPVTAVTLGVLNTTIFCTKLGAGQMPQGQFFTSATLTTAGVPMVTLGMSHLTTTGTATFGSFVYDYKFDDTLILMPGTMVYPTGSAATASTYNVSIWWREYPVND